MIALRPLRAAADVSPLRLAAAVGAVLLVVTSRGDVLLVGALLGVSVGSVAGAAAAMLAGAAALVRWGTSSLDALGGAQAVLGPAGWVGPTAAAASAWLAGAALLLSTPERDRVTAVALGVVAAALVAGPHGRLGLRVLATLVAVALALLMARWGAAGLGRRLAGWPAVGAGALAVLMAAAS